MKYGSDYFMNLAREKGLFPGGEPSRDSQRAATFPLSQPIKPPVFSAPESVEAARPLPPLRLAYHLNPSESLTECLNRAEHPATARRIFRLLHELALHSIHARGLPHRPSVGVFHLPVDLIAAHLEIDRSTVWRNLQPLLTAGILDARDHYDSLKGMTAVTGKIWAVAIAPERVLSGQAERVKVRIADLNFPWRDLTADVEQSRTAYNLTRTEARQQADKAARDARAEVIAQARLRAQERKGERDLARMRGEKVPRGRHAATVNASQTRAEKPRPTRPRTRVQQSREGLKAVEKAELIKWTLAPFSNHTQDVTLTVARAFSDGLDAIFTLPSLAGLSKADRNAAVEQTARTLAAAFEDSQNFRFWAWLIWQLIRGADQGQDWTDDVAHVLARILQDVRQDEMMGARVLKRPAAAVVKELRQSGLMDALGQIAPTRAGRRPKPTLH